MSVTRIESVYEIIESAIKGKIAVATRNLKPGDLILAEKEPILFVDFTSVASYEKGIDHMNAVYVASYRVFKYNMTEEARDRFNQLHGPITGSDADLSRVNFAKLIDLGFPLEPQDVEIFVKIARVMRLNMFTDQVKGGYAAFGEVTRLAHSCFPNCGYDIQTGCTCFAFRPILAGEELTISYSESDDAKSTHDRRFHYLQFKEFTCHCPRCDALGDDTRQFKCSNPACKGSMTVRQPLNKDELFDSSYVYDGVEYVEPHLLPCTLCHLVPSTHYQSAMLKMEKDAPIVKFSMNMELREAIASSDHSMLEKFAQKLQGLLELAPCCHHSAFFEMLLMDVRVHHVTTRTSRHKSFTAMQAAVARYIGAYEEIFAYPHNEVAKALCQVVVVLPQNIVVAGDGPSCALPPLDQLALCQRAKRTLLLLHGRTSKMAHVIDAPLLSAIAAAGCPPVSASQCALCNESPEEVAITLSRCGRCKRACYCSAGCQKAHWKLHKKECKPAK